MISSHLTYLVTSKWQKELTTHSPPWNRGVHEVTVGLEFNDLRSLELCIIDLKELVLKHIYELSLHELKSVLTISTHRSVCIKDWLRQTDLPDSGFITTSCSADYFNQQLILHDTSFLPCIQISSQSSSARTSQQEVEGGKSRGECP